MGELVEQPDATFTREYVSPPSSLIIYIYGQNREQREHRVFQQLLQMVPGFEKRLLEGSDENVLNLAELVGFIFLDPIFGLNCTTATKRCFKHKI